MNWADIFQNHILVIAGSILAVFLVLWMMKTLLKWMLIFLIIGFLIWRFWLA